MSRVILTASGGPFCGRPSSELRRKTVEEALAHPRWKMGQKVTVDSATLMNKGLELIEARWLFDLAPDQLGVLIHPQSIVHALVEMRDGSVLAQLSPTDMRIPIQYALTYPERRDAVLPPLDLAASGRSSFSASTSGASPSSGLARRALQEGGSAPVALNAANEVAVEAFLAGRIGFPRTSATSFSGPLDGHRPTAIRGPGRHLRGRPPDARAGGRSNSSKKGIDMGTLLGTILAFIIVFGILVFIHEFGHFFMAKLVGIRVEVFSFGYGKRLFGIKKGHTDYRVSVLPHGRLRQVPGRRALRAGPGARARRFHGQDRAGSDSWSSSWARS